MENLGGLRNLGVIGVIRTTGATEVLQAIE